MDDYMNIMSDLEELDLEELVDEFNESTSKMEDIMEQINNKFSELETENISTEALYYSILLDLAKLNCKFNIFNKLICLSDELAEFLGEPVGSSMIMSEIVDKVKKYCDKLVDKKNRCLINPDEKLIKVLKISNNTVLSYFNLIVYIKKSIFR